MKRLLLLIAAFLLIGVPMANSAEFLIFARAHWMDALTPTEINGMDQASLDNYTSRSQKGDIVVIGPDGKVWGNAEGLPDYILVKVPEITYSQALAYAGQWNASLQLSVLSSNLATDTHTVQVSADNVNIHTGEGKVAQARIQNYLTNWKFKNISTGDNYVQFDATISEVLQSQKYLGIDCSLCTFTETNYDQATGTHRTRIDASALNLTLAQFDAAVVRITGATGGTLISQNRSGRRAVWDFTRSAVQDKFTREINRRYQRMIRKYRFSIPSATVDDIIALGGIVTLTQADFMTLLHDKQNAGE